LAGIRVTYTGYIAVIIRLLSIVTGLVFTLIVTRQLSAEEFGTWGLINGIIVYALMIQPVISYWSTRETARGEDSGKTAITSTGLFSIIGISIYLVIAYFVGLQSNADVDVLILAAILIPVLFINQGLTAIVVGHKPQVSSYGFIVFELTKIPAGLALVYYLQMGVEGAIYASLIAYLASIILLYVNTKEKLKTKLKKTYIKKWLKLFWVPIYRGIPSLISMSDVVVFSIMTGSVVGVAYYTAARTIGFLVHHSRAIGTGVYPKLLEGGHEKILRDNLVQFFYLSFPMIAISITFARPGLFALNPIYEIASPVVILLSLRQFLTSFNMLLFRALQGIENVDQNRESTFKDYAKSKLVLFPTFQMIRHGIYIASLAIILVFFNGGENDEINLVIYWALIGLIVEIPLSAYIVNLTRKSFTLKMNYKAIFKYLMSSIIVFGLMYFLIEEYLVFNENIFEFLPNLSIYLIGGALAYLGITYGTDKKTRILVKAIVKEITKK